MSYVKYQQLSVTKVINFLRKKQIIFIKENVSIGVDFIGVELGQEGWIIQENTQMQDKYNRQNKQNRQNKCNKQNKTITAWLRRQRCTEQPLFWYA